MGIEHPGDQYFDRLKKIQKVYCKIIKTPLLFVVLGGKKVENMDDESIACFGGSIHQLGRDMRYNGELSGVFSICQLYILFLLNTKKFCKKKKSEYLLLINNMRGCIGSESVN